jgi:hypothetical protein
MADLNYINCLEVVSDGCWYVVKPILFCLHAPGSGRWARSNKSKLLATEPHLPRTPPIFVSSQTVIQIPSPETSSTPLLLSWCCGGIAGERRGADYTSISLSSPCNIAHGDFCGGSRLGKEAEGRRTEEVVWAVSLPNGKAMT